jgi:CDP-diacylglycerol--glycerol-3-phosphate 3-phosphatidyltransferase
VVASGTSQVSNGNIANLITVARILLAPVFVWLVLLDASEHGIWRWMAAALFIVAISSDGLDGALARKRNLITTTGILLDPIADKVLIGGALIALALVGELPWWVVVVIVVRELGITVFRFVALKNRVIPASKGGKLKTILQAVAISSWLVPTWVLLGDWVFTLNWVLMAGAIALTVSTGVEYLWKAFRAPVVPQ